MPTSDHLFPVHRVVLIWQLENRFNGEDLFKSGISSLLGSSPNDIV